MAITTMHHPLSSDALLRHQRERMIQAARERELAYQNSSSVIVNPNDTKYIITGPASSVSLDPRPEESPLLLLNDEDI